MREDEEISLGSSLGNSQAHHSLLRPENFLGSSVSKN